jgi:hypothetical protein
VVAHLAKTYGVSERQALRYVEKVREGWRRGAPRDIATREQRRDEVRATIDEVIRQAMARRKPLRGADGDPVLGADSEPVLVPDPDLRAALHGLRLAIQLDALEAPSDVGRLMHSTAPSAPALAADAETKDPDVIEAEAVTVEGPSPVALAAKLKGQARNLIALPGGRGRASEG